MSLVQGLSAWMNREMFENMSNQVRGKSGEEDRNKARVNLYQREVAVFVDVMDDERVTEEVADEWLLERKRKKWKKSEEWMQNSGWLRSLLFVEMTQEDEEREEEEKDRVSKAR